MSARALDLKSCPEIKDEPALEIAELCRDHEGCKLILNARSSCDRTRQFLGALNVAVGEGTPGLFGRRRTVTPETVYRAFIDKNQASLEAVPEAAEALKQLRGTPAPRDPELKKGKFNNGEAYAYYGPVDPETGLAYRFHATGSVILSRFDGGRPTLSDLVYENGRRYVGALSNGWRTVGSGIDEKGNIVVGEWTSDKIAKGRLVRADGTRFEGTFTNGLRAEGTEFTADGKAIEKGTFDERSLVKGTRYDADGAAVAVNRQRDERDAAQKKSLASLTACAELQPASKLVERCEASPGCAILLAARTTCPLAASFIDRLAAAVSASPGGRLTADVLFEANLEQRVRSVESSPAARAYVDRIRGLLAGREFEPQVLDVGAVYYGEMQGALRHGIGWTFWPTGGSERGQHTSGRMVLGESVTLDGVRMIGTYDNNRIIEGIWLRADGTRSEGRYAIDGNGNSVLSVGTNFDAAGTVTGVDRPREQQMLAQNQQLAQMEAQMRATEQRIAASQAAAERAAREEAEARELVNSIVGLASAFLDARARNQQAQAAQQQAQQAAARRAQQEREKAALQQQLQAQRLALQRAQQAERERLAREQQQQNAARQQQERLVREQQERERLQREQQARVQQQGRQIPYQESLEKERQRNLEAQRIAQQQSAQKSTQSNYSPPPSEPRGLALGPNCQGLPAGARNCGFAGPDTVDREKLAREKREFEERMKREEAEKRAKQAEINRKLQEESKRNIDQATAYRNDINSKNEQKRIERERYVNGQASRRDAVAVTVLSINNCPTARFHNRTDINLSITYYYKGTIAGGKEGPSGSWTSWVGPNGTNDSQVPAYFCEPGWKVDVYEVRWQATPDNYYKYSPI